MKINQMRAIQRSYAQKRQADREQLLKDARLFEIWEKQDTYKTMMGFINAAGTEKLQGVIDEVIDQMIVDHHRFVKFNQEDCNADFRIKCILGKIGLSAEADNAMVEACAKNLNEKFWYMTTTEGRVW